MTTTDHLHSHLNSGQPTSPSAGRRARPNATVRQPPRVDTDRTDENDAPEAPVVLLVHGQPGSSLVWARVQPLLHNRGLHVLAVDRPGYGDTGGAASNQFDNAAALAKVLDEQVRSPAVIVGHSLGAGIALALAATAPRHVRALVLVAPAAGPSAITTTDRILAARFLGVALTWFGFRTAGLVLHIPSLRKRFLTDRVGLSVAEAREVVRRISHGDVWRSFTIEQRHLATDAHRLEEHLGTVTCPVVILAGTRDHVVRPRAVAAIVKRLPESNLFNTQTGHLIPIDDPRLWSTPSCTRCAGSSAGRCQPIMGSGSRER